MHNSWVDPDPADVRYRKLPAAAAQHRAQRQQWAGTNGHRYDNCEPATPNPDRSHYGPTGGATALNVHAPTLRFAGRPVDDEMASVSNGRRRQEG